MDLFDIIEAEEKKETLAAVRANPASCRHEHEVKTFTVYPGLLVQGKPGTDERMTLTCEGCGRIRGRCR